MKFVIREIRVPSLKSAILVASAAALAATVLPAQTPGRLATTTGALRASPVFFHGKQVAVLGSLAESRDLFRLEPPGADTARATEPVRDLDSKPIYVYWRERPRRTDGEIRGEFWDLGRLEAGAPADLVAWDTDHEGAFALRLGAVRPQRIWIGGREVPIGSV